MSKKDSWFYLGLPPGWEDQTVYFFRGPRIDDREHMIQMIIDRNLQSDDIGEYATERTRPITENLPSVEVLKDEEVTIEGGNPCHEFVFKFNLTDEIHEFHKYIFVFKDEMGFIFNGKFSKKTYKMLSGQVKDLVERLLPGTYKAPEE